MEALASMSLLSDQNPRINLRPTISGRAVSLGAALAFSFSGPPFWSGCPDAMDSLLSSPSGEST